LDGDDVENSSVHPAAEDAGVRCMDGGEDRRMPTTPESRDDERSADVGDEFPDPDTPPDLAAGAPGPDVAGHREHGQGQFNAAQAAERDAD
jgi:hypothetical protein